MVNAAVTALLHPWVPWREKAQTSSRTLRAGAWRVGLAATAFALTSAAAFYGYTELHEKVSEKEITVSVIQGNIEQDRKWDPKLAEWIMARYAGLSREASPDRPRMIIWPEAATPGYVLKNLALLKNLVLMIREINTYFLIGSSEYPKFAKGPIDPSKGGNTALFFSPEAQLLGQYIKVRLVPFKEAIPYQGKIPWPRFIVPEGRRTYLVPGEEMTLLSLDDGSKFGVLICWETLFPDLSRAIVKGGAQFIANISNEAAFGETVFPHQFLAITTFRAVENRIAVVRAANTGISCFIDPYGRIPAKLEKNNKDIFVEGHLTHQVSLSRKRTFYTLHGDLFAYACLAISAVMMALSFLRRKHL
jgi:apolipoprotein N-acyltransferase